MLRTLITASAFGCFLLATPASASTTSTALELATDVAAKPKGPAKAKANGKKDKPAEAAAKPIEKPESKLPADPRASAASADPAGGGAGMSSEVRRGMSRIEFDDRLIQGQTNKANAIYLFERRESALRSLLKKRSHFHEEIDETLE